MAMKRSDYYPGRFNAPTTAYPQGAFKNRTAPGAKDGSYLEQEWARDWDGFFAMLLNQAGIVPNGTVDTGLISQYFQALQLLTLSRKNPFADIKADGTSAVATARSNLDIPTSFGTAAAVNVGQGTGQIPDMSFFTSLKAASGWQKLPGGLIIQWGSGTYNNTIVNLPITFPNLFAAATVSPDPEATTAVELADIYPKSNSTALVACSYSAGSGAWVSAALKCTWMAIGY